MLEIENLTLKYGQSQILNGITMTAKPGQVTAVMGTNGVGKTSLLKAIAGRHPYDKGTIRLDGKDLPHLTAFGAARAGIAYVPQGREVFPLMTLIGLNAACPIKFSSFSQSSKSSCIAVAATSLAGSNSSWQSRVH